MSANSDAPQERPPEQIRVGALSLERWRSGDAAELLAAVSESSGHLVPWMPWAANHDAAAAARFIADSEQGWTRAERFEYAIRDLRECLLGGVGMLARIGPGGLEIGYWLHVEHTRRGVATSAVAALSEAALAMAAITHVEIHHDEANHASGAVPARLGFRELGVWPQPPQAPAESGREVRWRLDAEQFATSPASALLEGLRAREPSLQIVTASATGYVDEAAEIWARATAARDGDRDVATLEQSRPVIEGALARSPRSMLVVALAHSGQPVAFAAIEPVAPGHATADGATEAQVRYLGVHPDQWGRGIGAQLLRALPAHLKAAGFRAAHLTVYADNERAINLYESAGWRAAPERIVHPKTGKPMRRYESAFE